MRSQTSTKKNPAARVVPKIRSTMPWHVTFVEALPNFRLRVRFVDGLEGFVNMSARARSTKAGVFAVLADPDFFNKVYVEMGVVTWPGELDLAPDAMHDEIKKSGEWKLK